MEDGESMYGRGRAVDCLLSPYNNTSQPVAIIVQSYQL